MDSWITARDYIKLYKWNRFLEELVLKPGWKSSYQSYVWSFSYFQESLLKPLTETLGFIFLTIYPFHGPLNGLFKQIALLFTP